MKILFVPLFLLSSSVWAAGLTVRGQLLKPDSTPVTGTVQFKMQVRSPGVENCLMFEETFSIDMTGANGAFSLTLNDGTGTRTDAGTHDFEQIFRNGPKAFSFTPAACSGTSVYAPGANDERKIVLSYNDGNGYDAFPPLPLSHVARSFDSGAVGGFGANSLLRFVDGTGEPAAVGALPFSDFLGLVAILNGSADIGGKAAGFTGALAGDVVGGQGATEVRAIRGVDVSNTSPVSGQALVYDGSKWKPTSLPGGGTVTAITPGTGMAGSGTPITTSGTLAVDVGTTAGKIVQVDTDGKLPALDGSKLTNVNVPFKTVTAGTGITATNSGGDLTLAVDHGTGSNKIVKLDSSGRLPAVDGSQLTNMPAVPFSTATLFTSNGSFSVPLGVTKIYCQVWGGGGGGSGGQEIILDTGAGGNGGGAGGYAAEMMSVSSGVMVTVTVGSGGSGGVASQGSGNAGGTSTACGLTATGGAGATGSSTGLGGTHTSVLGIDGGSGGAAQGKNGATGGSSPQGGQGGSGSVNGALAGRNGGLPGGGGGGGAGGSSGGSSKGGNGAAGRVIIWY